MSCLEGVLDINEQVEIDKVSNKIRALLRDKIKRRGLVVAISGGIDSAVCAALSVKAIGKKKVFGLLLPEHDSSSESVTLGRELAEQLGIEYLEQDIGPSLDGIGCYKWRDEAMRNVFPEYSSNWKSKITIAGVLEGQVTHFNLIVQSPDGELKEARMGLKDYLQVVAATSYKQRLRKTVEYFHADRLNYGVIGTPNRLEYDQGFFVKNGDGSADIKPIAHLYKTQVYALARHMELPEKICQAAPTTDTYSLSQGQDEFYFALPYQQMDVALWAYNNKVESQEVAKYLNMSAESANLIYKDIETKRKTTRYLHLRPQLIESVDI